MMNMQNQHHNLKRWGYSVLVMAMAFMVTGCEKERRFGTGMNPAYQGQHYNQFANRTNANGPQNRPTIPNPQLPQPDGQPFPPPQNPQAPGQTPIKVDVRPVFDPVIQFGDIKSSFWSKACENHWSLVKDEASSEAPLINSDTDQDQDGMGHWCEEAIRRSGTFPAIHPQVKNGFRVMYAKLSLGKLADFAKVSTEKLTNRNANDAIKKIIGEEHQPGASDIGAMRALFEYTDSVFTNPSHIFEQGKPWLYLPGGYGAGAVFFDISQPRSGNFSIAQLNGLGRNLTTLKDEDLLLAIALGYLRAPTIGTGETAIHLLTHSQGRLKRSSTKHEAYVVFIGGDIAVSSIPKAYFTSSEPRVKRSERQLAEDYFSFTYSGNCPQPIMIMQVFGAKKQGDWPAHGVGIELPGRYSPKDNPSNDNIITLPLQELVMAEAPQGCQNFENTIEFIEATDTAKQIVTTTAAAGSL